MQLHPIVQTLLTKRGLTDQQIKELLSWELRDLPPLLDLLDLKKGAALIIEAILSHKTIAIYSDYDVDGLTSAAILSAFFKDYLKIEEKKLRFYQPNRFIEGYGLHPTLVEKAVEEGVDLLITVDCGITNKEAAEKAQALGLDLIITDHHTDILPELPCAKAVINPNRRDEPKESPLKVLSGVGVAFALCTQVRKDWPNDPLPTLYALLPFVAIGTLCDMVPLTSLNLKLVRHGIRELKEKRFPGLAVFFPENGDAPYKADYEQITFQIGPMINSKGRVEHPQESLFLLQSSDAIEAKQHHDALWESNRQRKQIQREVVREALKQIVGEELDRPIHILYSPQWHEGVVGIAASKVVECTKKPVIILTNAKEASLIKGSARSFGDLHLFELLQRVEDLFVKFGGHKAAAGLTLERCKLPLLKKCLYEMMERYYPRESYAPTSRVEMTISPSEVTVPLLRSLEAIEPFGTLNPRPYFYISPLKLDHYKILKDEHVQWQFSDPFSSCRLRGISFNYFERIHVQHPEKLLQISKDSFLVAEATLHGTFWQGREYLQLHIHHLKKLAS